MNELDIAVWVRLSICLGAVLLGCYLLWQAWQDWRAAQANPSIEPLDLAALQGAVTNELWSFAGMGLFGVLAVDFVVTRPGAPGGISLFDSQVLRHYVNAAGVLCFTARGVLALRRRRRLLAVRDKERERARVARAMAAVELGDG